MNISPAAIVSVRQHDLALPFRLLDRVGLKRVDRETVEPTGAEHDWVSRSCSSPRSENGPVIRPLRTLPGAVSSSAALSPVAVSVLARRPNTFARATAMNATRGEYTTPYPQLRLPARQIEILATIERLRAVVARRPSGTPEAGARKPRVGRSERPTAAAGTWLGGTDPFRPSSEPAPTRAGVRQT